MQSSYKSVTLFYVDLKALLVGSGMTIERTLGDYDVILDAGEGSFVRLQKLTTSTTSAIGILSGTDPEVLAVTAPDSERCLPFALLANAEFAPTYHWVPTEKFLSFCVSVGPNGTSPSRKYRADFRFAERTQSVFHQDHLHPQYQPNFKDTGGPYIPAGA